MVEAWWDKYVATDVSELTRLKAAVSSAQDAYELQLEAQARSVRNRGGREWAELTFAGRVCDGEMSPSLEAHIDQMNDSRSWVTGVTLLRWSIFALRRLSTRKAHNV